MRKLLLLPILLAGCASQTPVAPVSTPQDWERWLQIGPNCRRHYQRACLARTEPVRPAESFQLAVRPTGGPALN
jgi:hypothetical protein